MAIKNARFILFITVAVQLYFSQKYLHASDNNLEEVKPSVELGAQIFIKRCVLCHGDVGFGDGIMPQKIKAYPNTNLHNPKYPTAREDVLRITIYGGSQGKMSNFMPPMGNDLTWTQLHSVVDFVGLLRKDTDRAKSMLKNIGNTSEISQRVGQDIYKDRCVLCHGTFGKGNGRMARVIKNPPPFDLTLSRLPESYLTSIISGGGDAVGRSPQMPPWKDELSESEIKSVIQYIISLRE